MSLRQEFLKSSIALEKRGNNGKSLLEARDNNLALDDATDLFLAHGLEYVDTYLHKPLYKFFALRDVPMLMVGGAKEEVSYFKANYSISSVANGLSSGNNQVIPTVKANIEKSTTRIVPRNYVLEFGYIDELKAREIGFDFMNLFDEGIRHAYNAERDKVAYYGLDEFNGTAVPSEGLINASDVKVETVTTKFEEMTGVELIETFVGALTDVYERMAYDGRLLPDRLLVPLALFKRLIAPLAVVGDANTTATTGVTTLEFLKTAINQALPEENVSISILPLPYLATAGNASKGRAILYKFDNEVVRMPIGMDLTRGATLFDISSVATKTLYTAFIGEPQFIRKTAITYIDNIA